MNDLLVSPESELQPQLDDLPPGCRQAAAARTLGAQLESVREVLASLPAPLYRAAPSRASGSIGAHVRHCLDHVRALVAHRSGTELSYDARLRGTAVEREPRAAVDEICRLCLDLEDITEPDLDRQVELRTLTERHGAPIHVLTTVGRELAFVIQHTIHHAAIIRVLLEQLAVAVPAEFGYAPSTPLRPDTRLSGWGAGCRS